MTRVAKSEQVPESLGRTSAYDGEDVLRQLVLDQHSKCYVCERVRYTDFEVEHFVSRAGHPELRQEWRNLLLACRYCNGRKSDRFDGMLNPLDVNVEEEIVQDIDFENGVARFSAVHGSEQAWMTAEFLGFKYWIVKGNGELERVFGEDVVWNKC